MITGVMLLLYVLNTYGNSFDGQLEESNRGNYNLTYFSLLLFIGGFLFSSYAFPALRKPESRFNFLILPASTLEKFLSWFVITAVLFPLALILVYPIFAFFGEMVANYFGAEIKPFEIGDPLVWKHIRLYFVLQSIFLLGAAVFNSYPFPKVILSAFIVGVVLLGIGVLIFKITFWEYFDGFNFRSVEQPPEFDEGFESWMKNGGPKQIGEFLLYWILAPLFWTITWFHLKEREV